MTVILTPIVTSSILQDLIDQCRDITRDINDIDAPDSELLWKDTEWIRFLVEAEDEIARRTYCIKDITSSITLVADEATYAISNKILRIESLILPTSVQPMNVSLLRKTRKWLDDNVIGWRALASGTPQYFFEETGRVTLVPAPNAAYDTLAANYEAIRRPISPLSLLNTTPEIPEIYYSDMINYALYKAYGKKDSQTYNEQESMKYLSLFTQSVGFRPTGLEEKVLKEEPVDLQIGVSLW